MSSDYRLRIADPVLAEMVADFPIISIIGPRASGKTTTALRHAQGVIRLDEPGTAAVVQANPDAAIRDWLRDQVGDRFLHGLVLHTGPGLFELDDRISAAPISTLWS